jgi:hypothetical protein
MIDVCLVVQQQLHHGCVTTLLDCIDQGRHANLYARGVGKHMGGWTPCQSGYSREWGGGGVRGTDLLDLGCVGMG